MRLEIVAVDGDAVRVRLASAPGAEATFPARFSGPTPRVGDWVDVELDVEATLAWGRGIVALDSGDREHDRDRDGIAASGEAVAIVGTLLAAGADHAVLDCAGGVVLLACAGVPLPIGVRVRVLAPAVVLHDART